MGIIVVALAVFAYIGFKVNSRVFIIIAYSSCLFMLMYIMLNADFSLEMVTSFGQYMDFSLIANKATSATVRLTSYNDAVNGINSNFWGGADINTMTGLWLTVGQKGGFPMVLLYFIFSLSILLSSLRVFSNTYSPVRKFGVSLLASLSFVVFSITAYGWAEAPGVIALFLSYRLLQVYHSDQQRSV
jgi:hypothetical protein